MKTSVRLISISAICLLVGLVVGFFVSGRITKKRIHQKMEMQRPPMFKQHLLDNLDLNETQETAFEAAFDAHMKRMQMLDEAMRENREKEFKQLFAELRNGLTQEQTKKIDRVEERLLKRGRGPRGNRGPKGHRPNDGHPPPMME